MPRSSGFVSSLCLAVIGSCLAMLWAPTSAQVATASAAVARSVSASVSASASAAGSRGAALDGLAEVVPAGMTSAALSALSAGVTGGARTPERVRAGDLALPKAAAVVGAELAVPSALGRRMGLLDQAGPAIKPTAEPTVEPTAEAEPERAAATRLGRGAGGSGGPDSGSAMAPGGQGGSGSAVLCCVDGSADGAGYRLIAVDTRSAALEAEGRPPVRPG